MAVRIRKLARELNRTPAELIGVLHALGFSRYRSVDDMLPAPAEARLRLGLKNGVAPVPVEILDAGREAEPEDGPVVGADLMAQLVPGVVRAGAPRAPAPPLALRPPPDRLRPSAPVDAGVAEVSEAHHSAVARRSVPELRARIAEPEALHVDDEPPVRHGENGRGDHSRAVVVDADWRALHAERAALDSARRVLDSERTVLAAERDAVASDRRRYEAQVRALDGERAALESLARALELERGALDAERAALAAQQGRLKAAELVPVQDLLEERGLRGSDEFERAVAALAQSRLLRDALWTLRVDAPEVLRRLLAERVVLVDAAPPEALARAAATVIVSPDRAEVPAAATLSRALAVWGEGLLLHGLRRVTLVGGRSLWHRLLKEGVDPRVDVRFVPARTREAAQASADVERADLVVLWGVQVMPTARAVYNAARARVVEVEDGGPVEMMAAVIHRLNA